MNLTGAKEKTKKDYSKIAEFYISDFASTRGKGFRLLDDLVDRIRERRMLLRYTIDLGSGPGSIINYLIKKGLTRFIAVDITPEFCEYIREKFRNILATYVEVIEGDMVDVVKELKKGLKGAVAAVTAGFSIIHIPDNEIDDLFKDIYDLLEIGGLFYVSSYEGRHKGMELQPKVLTGSSSSKTQERLEVYMNYFTKEELEERLETAGFHILDSIRHKPDVIPGEIPVHKLQILAEKHDR